MQGSRFNYCCYRDDARQTLGVAVGFTDWLQGEILQHCRANIKVSSTETGAIFGNIVYEDTLSSGRNVVVLNDIHIDIMDYISPALCADVQFRSMWAEFEWENKVKSFPLVRPLSCASVLLPVTCE